MNSDWQAKAQCRRTTDRAVFFPRGKGETWAQDAEDAKAICAWCPVRKDCLEYALDYEGAAGPEKRAGIYGGYTPRERVALDKHRRAAA